jgi:serine/threonine-protein kinase
MSPLEQAKERLAAALADRYHVERELGQGGMATVYLAEDLRHRRRVAIKVLKPELAAVIGAERFLHEIRTIATLQHPHILGLIDSGDADGTAYFVMPYVEGESLRERLTREKQLPVAEAIRIASEAASALDYAHRHDVIHRDIKPENILLHDGQALVADFGIALAASKAGGTRMTETGMSLGTPQYMSPEQAMGEREITARSDVYALGAVLYEMLVGDPPFTASTAQGIVAKVVTEEPAPPRRYRRAIPESVEAAVLTALEKLPADRFGSAAEFAAALGAPGAVASGAQRRRPRPGDHGIGHRPVATAAVLGGALLVGALAGMRLRGTTAPAGPPTRFEIVAPGLGFSPFRNFALSADGRFLVYFVAGGSDRSGLWIRAFDQLEPKPLSAATGGGNPLISPDGRELLASRSSQMFRVPLGGGQAVPLPDVPETAFNALAASGDLIYTARDGGIWRLPRTGARQRISAPDTASGERTQVLTDLLPGDETALVVANVGTGWTGRLYALDLRSGERRVLLDTDVRGAWYAGHGALVFVTGDQMLSGIRFDPRSLETRGDPVQLGGPVASMPLGLSRVAVSRTGSVAYAPRNPSELALVLANGDTRTLVGRQGEYHNPRFSPDGRSISVDINDPTGRDVWVHSLDQGTLTRVTFDNDGHDAVWSRDGRSLLYVASREGRSVLLRTRMDGTPGEQLTKSAVTAPGAWLADGRFLVVTAGESRLEGWNIMAESAGALSPFIATPFSEGWPAVSPDGRWLAYVSDASRRLEVYLRPVEGSTARIQVSVDGGTEPVWGSHGRTLYYRRTATAGHELVAASLDLGDPPRVASRKSVLDLAEFEGAEPHPNFAVAADGRFVMVRRTRDPNLVFIQNVQRLIERKGDH